MPAMNVLAWKKAALRKLKLEIDRTDNQQKLEKLVDTFVNLAFDVLASMEKRRITEQ